MPGYCRWRLILCNPASSRVSCSCRAFVAAVLGGITSLPGAFVGGILLGLVQSFATVVGTNNSFLNKNVTGVGDLAILVVLIVVLLVRPAGLLGKVA